MKRDQAASVWLLLSLGLAAWPFATGEPLLFARDDVPVVEMKQICGALLRDDFNGDRIDQNKWRISTDSPGIRVESGPRAAGRIEQGNGTLPLDAK